MQVHSLEIADVVEIFPKKHSDARGFFSETYVSRQFRDAGFIHEWAQDNQAFSRERGVLRGLHFQLPPCAQDKLIRVLNGSIFDVAVDIRRNSPTFGKWVSCTLSAEAFNQLYIPKGFAHGYVTLEPETEVFYKVSAPYTPSLERSISFSDPEINIVWPQPPSAIIVSEKDRNAPRLAEILNDISFD